MITVEFKTDNAAFDGDEFFMESGRILSKLADQVSGGRTGPIPLTDTNGNKVGMARVTRETS